MSAATANIHREDDHQHYQSDKRDADGDKARRRVKSLAEWSFIASEAVTVGAFRLAVDEVENMAN